MTTFVTSSVAVKYFALHLYFGNLERAIFLHIAIMYIDNELTCLNYLKIPAFRQCLEEFEKLKHSMSRHRCDSLPIYILYVCIQCVIF